MASQPSGPTPFSVAREQLRAARQVHDESVRSVSEIARTALREYVDRAI